jgi:hypothetical protein
MFKFNISDVVMEGDTVTIDKSVIFKEVARYRKSFQTKEGMQKGMAAVRAKKKKKLSTTPSCAPSTGAVS